MTANCIAPDRPLLRGAHGARRAARRYMARSTRGAPASRSACSARSSACSTGSPASTRRGHGLEALRGRVAGVQRARHPARVRAAAAAGRAAAQPGRLPAVDPSVAFNTAVSFATNTNWQAYGGETTMSHLIQMLALTVQNFVSAATGMAVLVALDPRLHAAPRERHRQLLGRPRAHDALHPVAALVRGRAVPRLAGRAADASTPKATVPLLESTTGADGTAVTEQAIALGPVASQIAIKQLGTNGGGFYNVNSAHPFENPTPLSNFFEMIAILLIAAALCFTFGGMVRDRAPGLGAVRGDVRDPHPAAVRVRRRRAGGQPRPHAACGVDQVASALAARRQHGRQGGALRHRELRAVGDRDDRRVERLGQLDARQLHAARRPGADVADRSSARSCSAASARASTACSSSRSSRCSSPA